MELFAKPGVGGIIEKNMQLKCSRNISDNGANIYM